MKRKRKLTDEQLAKVRTLIGRRLTLQKLLREARDREQALLKMIRALPTQPQLAREMGLSQGAIRRAAIGLTYKREDYMNPVRTLAA